MQRKTFSFFRAETGKQETVLQEIWCWEAHYVDGSVLKQFDEQTGTFHQFSEIEQAKLHVFKMVSPFVPQQFMLGFNPERMSLIHYYKNYGFDFMGTHQKARVYVFGYKTLVKRIGGDVEIGTYNLIMPSGELVTTDQPNSVELEG